ncbi:serine/threonine protein kinase [Spirulina subsalsa FACHB-351]|uniref:non-specific serine/threonine protein kinase n=1 Tax=Spirulina subsalsa FACHB-351 TaxID=234711 RepID=A0ABT3L2S9_9CYAN|nr:serine/threonine-protein kinase [Spirulina subsalsa]MCW6035809.1 serine/threonine protein kinase [Spirulina subsalsa FACHB-351]
MNTFYQAGDCITNPETGYCYEVLALLGQGSFGQTYLAHTLAPRPEQDPSRQQVAIKVVSLKQMGGWKELELWEREVQTLGKLDHPGIPNYLDCFEQDTAGDRLFYLVQERVKGKSLAQWVEQGWQPSEKAIKWIAQETLRILEYLHSFHPPILHRDIKPENLILDSSGKVSLIDFGAVQTVYRDADSVVKTFVGTLGYMPPEQYQGKSYPTSDLYSLGATLVFVITGRSPDDLPHKGFKLNFRPYTNLSPHLTHWLETLLEPAREDRFKSAADARMILQQEAKIAQSVTVVPPPSWSRIKVKKTANSLAILCPPVGVNEESLPILIVGILGGVILPLLVFVDAEDMGEAVVQAITYSLLTWIVCFCCGLLFAFWGSIEITINSQEFWLEWRIGNFVMKSWQGKTGSPNKIELDVQVCDRETETTTCELRYKGEVQTFGKLLSIEEQEWLVAQINQFLAEQKEGS